MSNQYDLEEFEDRLAHKIARENDLRARQRLDQMMNPQKYWSAKQKRRNDLTIIICVALFIAISVFALSFH